jgi:hypothetical protein
VLDDATSKVLSAELFLEENTFSCLKVLQESFDLMGIPCSLYVDRAGHFFKTKTKGQKVDYDVVTQIGRAVGGLGCTLIPSYTPQSRGRMERQWLTLQGRLPQELRLRGITTVEKANEFIRNEYIQEYNQKFSILPKTEISAYVPIPTGVEMELVFSVQTKRLVKADNTVKFRNNIYQLEKQDRYPMGMEGLRVTVHELTQGGIAITFQERVLGRYSGEIPVGLRIDLKWPIGNKRAA